MSKPASLSPCYKIRNILSVCCCLHFSLSIFLFLVGLFVGTRPIGPPDHFLLNGFSTWRERDMRSCSLAGDWNPRSRVAVFQSCRGRGREEESMGSGIGAVLVLAAACLTLAPPCTLASSRKFDLSIAQPNLLNSTGGSFTQSSRFGFDPTKSKRLSWHPRVFLYEGFLSDMECDHLVSMARGEIESSLLVNHSARNSSQNNIDPGIKLHLADSKDVIVSKIEDRISLWSFLPKEYGEGMEILKYGVSQSDHNKDETQSSSGGNRLATILMYLSDIKQGGETVFPKSELKDSQSKEGTLSECGGYAVKPVKGNAILLFNLNLDGVTDKDSEYEACPVLEGEKWLAVKHIHVSKIDKSKSSQASEDECTDQDDNCVSWAAAGECDRNPVFMIGSPDYYGTCRKSCRAC